MRIFKKLKRLLYGNYRLAIKEGLKVGRGVSVMGDVNFGSEPYLITLEDEVRISFGVSFVTHDGGTWAFRDQPEYCDIIKYGKIHIGRRTFLGCNSIIMPGVTIGERCVVAAGSVVTKDIPDGHVVAGVPARILMTTEEYARKSKTGMEEYDVRAYHNNKREYLQKWL